MPSFLQNAWELMSNWHSMVIVQPPSCNYLLLPVYVLQLIVKCLERNISGRLQTFTFLCNVSCVYHKQALISN